MKKTLALFLAICMIATFTSISFATSKPIDSSEAFNFDNLLEGEGDVHINQIEHVLNGKLINGFWVSLVDNSPLDNILTTSIVGNIPVFTLHNPTSGFRIFSAFEPSEYNKRIYIATEYKGSWMRIPFSNLYQPISWLDSSDTIGYTSDMGMYFKNIKMNRSMLFINEDGIVYPIILVNTTLDSGIDIVLEDYLPPNNEELTILLQEKFSTHKKYSYFINPEFNNNPIDSGDKDSGDIDSGETNHSTHVNSSTRKLVYSIELKPSDGGTISNSNNDNIFKVGDINQTYTITADEGYTIHYIEVDGKIVPNSIDCGDTTTITFDCIYGNRNINAVFKKKS